jgi:hypothetical protein
MKTWFLVLSFLCFAILSMPARADHHEVFIQDVFLLDQNTCGVELEIDADNQDAFQGTDRIEINGILLAELGDTEAATINTGGNVNAGDNILFASSNFVADTALQADVVFDNADCVSFATGAVFSFVIDDPLFGGPNAVIDSVTLPGGFGFNTAVSRGSDSSSPDLMDLFNETVIVRNNAGQQVTLGVEVDGDGGCQLSAASAKPKHGWQVLGFGILALGLVRKLARLED